MTAAATISTAAQSTDPMIDRSAAPAVSGAPRLILRLEGGVVLAFAASVFARSGHGWGLFALWFLAPDLSMLGYLAGRRIGAISYNLGHGYASPAALAGLGLAFGWPIAWALALVWVAHIGFDRLLGYGLKYPTAFGHTHLGWVGKARR